MQLLIFTSENRRDIMVLPSLDGDNKKGNQGLPPMDFGPTLPDMDDSFKEEHEDFGDSGDGFINVDTEDSSEEEDNSNDELYRDVDEISYEEEKELPSMSFAEGVEHQTEDDYNPEYEEDLEDSQENEDKFIDKKKKRLLPFGGKKSKRKVKSSDFDARKNILAKTKYIRAGAMLTVMLLFVFGIKNTFFPSHVYSDSEIREFAREGAGQTLFPKERGRAFVEGFMQTYLTLDRTRPELEDSLSHFYGKDSFAEVGYDRMNITPGLNVKQNVLIGPSVFDVELLTDYSALYKVSAFVTDTDGDAIKDGVTTGRWVSFAINVYHNEDTGGLAITPDSPSIIPTYEISEQELVPERADFGNGKINEDIGPSINPTINGFVQAYADSSVESHEPILQYIEDKNDISLYDGFDGSVKLNGEPSEAIQRVIYDSDDGIYRVVLTVNWIDTKTPEGEKGLQYQGKYVMRVKPDEAGKYSVSSFVPYTYYK